MLLLLLPPLRQAVPLLPRLSALLTLLVLRLQALAQELGVVQDLFAARALQRRAPRLRFELLLRENKQYKR